MRIMYLLTILILVSIGFLLKCSSSTDPEPTKNDEAKNFTIIVADWDAENGGAVIGINPETGEQTIISSGNNIQSGAMDVAVDENGFIYANINGYPTSITKIDPENGNQTLLSINGYLKVKMDGIAVNRDGNLLVTTGSYQTNPLPRLLRINSMTGDQEILSEWNSTEDMFDVTVSIGGNIYVSSPGALFLIDPFSGNRTEVFRNGDYYGLRQIAIDKKGNVYACGIDKIIYINPSTGQSNEIISQTDNVYFDAITISDNGEIFVIKHRCCPRFGFEVCRVDVNNKTLTPFSYGNYLSLPSGMDILYNK